MNSYSLIVIGAGAGGLVVAIGAAKAGKKVLLIEQGRYGGDCTNYGCIPSKSLIASAEIAYSLKAGKALGIDFSDSSFNGDGALERTRGIIAKIRGHEEPEALNKMGVQTLSGEASFVSPHRLEVKLKDGSRETVEGSKIVIATGSYPFIPPIEGLKEAPYLTNETIFDFKSVPKSLAILGAGPIGCELAQAFSRLGSKVTLIESLRGVMPSEEEDVGTILAAQFKKEGIDLFTKCTENLITYREEKFLICIDEGGKRHEVEAENLLVSTGRRPNVTALALDNAGVIYSEKGIQVDSYGRTNQKHIYAIGDCTGPPFFTHLAEHHGRAVLTSLLLPFKKKILTQKVPRVTYTDPEVASIGLSEKEATEKFGSSKIACYHVSFTDLDRAVCSGREEGFVRVVTKKWSSEILGATIVAPRAGEMLQEISFAMLTKKPLRSLAKLIHPYPVYSAALRKAADLWLTQTLLPSAKAMFGGKKP